MKLSYYNYQTPEWERADQIILGVWDTSDRTNLNSSVLDCWLAAIISCVLQERGDPPTANMSSKRAKGKNTKKRPQRATSNVFAMFDQSQIQEFKEAFNMIDQNRDGFIDKEDLHDMLASLGKCKGLFV